MSEATTGPALGKVMLLTAMAGGLGWGIRGQYGHETGAMMAGLLVGLTLVCLFCAGLPSLRAARAVALCAVGMGFGGAMTYGQTVGLTHDAPLIGNWAALRWGLLGLAIKGALWIGFGGAFLGMGLSGLRYRPWEVLAVFGGMLVLMFAGIWLFNEPYDPARRILPSIYFSDDWRWEPGVELKPRREKWGGFLLAFAGLVAYAGWVRRDRLARNLAGWAAFGGALGFPLGQCLQAFHAWNAELFRTGFLARIDPVINWWNMMETTFGAVFGAVLGLGLWLNRGQIQARLAKDQEPVSWSFKPPMEIGLLLGYLALLVCWEFSEFKWTDALGDLGVTMGVVPVLGILGGRWWPYFVAMPLTLVPIAGKTLRQLCYKEAGPVLDPALGWVIYGLVPLALSVGLAMWFIRCGPKEPAGRGFLGPALFSATWLYFGLNFAFFRFPWPWNAWTARTPNALIFTACAIGLTCLAVQTARKGSEKRR